MARAVIDELITLIEFKSSRGSIRSLQTFRAGLLSVRKAGLIAGAAVTALGFLTVKTNASVDAQAKFAKSIGVSFENLQELQFAGKLAGATAQDINSSLETLTKTMSSPIPGEYNRELLLLGIRIRGANKQLRPATEILLEIAKRMQGLSAIQQVQIGDKLGLSAGTIKLLQKGPKAIEEAMKRARAVGGVLPENAGKVAAQFDIQLTTLTTTVKGLVSAVVIGLTPAINSTVKSIQSFILANNKLISQDLKTFIMGIFLGFKNFFNILGAIVQPLDFLIEKLSGAKKSFTGVKQVAFLVTTILIGMGVAILSLVNVFTLVGIAAFAFIKFFGPTIRADIKLFMEDMDKLKSAIMEVVKAFETLVKIGPKASIKKAFKGLQTAGGAKGLVDIGGGVGAFKIPALNSRNNAATSTSSSVSARTNNNVTINVNGAQNPTRVASEVKKQLTLNQTTQIVAPGLNRPLVG